MKKKVALLLTTIVALGNAGTIFASDALAEKYAELENDEEVKEKCGKCKK